MLLICCCYHTTSYVHNVILTVRYDEITYWDELYIKGNTTRARNSATHWPFLLVAHKQLVVELRLKRRFDILFFVCLNLQDGTRVRNKMTHLFWKLFEVVICNTVLLLVSLQAAVCRHRHPAFKITCNMAMYRTGTAVHIRSIVPSRIDMNMYTGAVSQIIHKSYSMNLG